MRCDYDTIRDTVPANARIALRTSILLCLFSEGVGSTDADERNVGRRPKVGREGPITINHFTFHVVFFFFRTVDGWMDVRATRDSRVERRLLGSSELGCLG